MHNQGFGCGGLRRDGVLGSVPRVCHGLFLVFWSRPLPGLSLCRVHPDGAGAGGLDALCPLVGALFRRVVLHSTARKSKHVHAWGAALHPNGRSFGPTVVFRLMPACKPGFAPLPVLTYQCTLRSGSRKPCLSARPEAKSFRPFQPRLSVSAHAERASRTSVRAGRGERGDASDRTEALP